MSLATDRRAALLERLRGFGPAGATSPELMDYETAHDDRDPVRTLHLRTASLRMDLYEMQRHGLVQRISKRAPSSGRGGMAIVWRAKEAECPKRWEGGSC
jgi:hypothetical protein